MGKIFPMAPLKVRLGLVRKCEKEARRNAAIAQSRLALAATALGPMRADARLCLKVPSKPVVIGLQRYNARRSREAKRKAEALRVNGDLAVSTAVKNLLKAIQESVDLIARLPRNDRGRVLSHNAARDGTPYDRFIKPSWAFARFTDDERRALCAAIRNHRAAAARLSGSIEAARCQWLAVSNACKEAERRDHER
jgi:hypothetical protein